MSIKETCIERIAGESYCTIYTSETKFINKIYQLAKEYPNDVLIITEGDESNGTFILAHVPSDWMKFVKPPTKRNFTDEQKAEMGERLKRLREEKK